MKLVTDWLGSPQLLTLLCNEGKKNAKPNGGGNMSKWISKRVGDWWTRSSALLNYAKPSSCCFRSTAKLSGESWGPQTGISYPWNQTPLRLPQTGNFRTDLQQQTLLNNQRGRCCSLTFSPRWRMVYFPLNFESQRDLLGSGVGGPYLVDTVPAFSEERSEEVGISAHLRVP